MRVSKLASLIAFSLVLAAGPALAEKDIEKVFGGITAEAGQAYGSLESVNGGITIREGATVRSAETVNGGISIDDNAKVGSAEAVNGGISLGIAATARSVETVNGGIRLDERARVDQDVETVNGGIKLEDKANRQSEAMKAQQAKASDAGYSLPRSSNLLSLSLIPVSCSSELNWASCAVYCVLSVGFNGS